MQIPWKHGRKVTIRSAIGYGMGDFYGGGQGVLVSTYLALFWTRFCGINIGSAQSILGISTIVSAFAALFFGVLDDNLYRFRLARRLGRRHLLMLMVPPLLIFGILLWIPGLPPATYLAVYVLWVVLGQMFQTAYNPLPGEMAQDFGERTLLSTVRMFVSSASGTLVPLIGGVVLAFAGEDHPTGYMIVAIAFIVGFIVATSISCWTTWELTPRSAGFGQWEDGTRQMSHIGFEGWVRRLRRIAGEYASTLQIVVFRQHLAMYLLILTASDIFGQTVVFFMLYNWNRTAAFASILLSCSVVSLPLTPVFGWMMTRIGPRRMYEIGFVTGLIGAAWLLASWLLRGHMPASLWLIFAVVGMLWFLTAKALYGYLPWTVFPYVADVDQIVTRRSRAATFSGMQFFARQLFSGVIMMLVGVVLSATGFDSTKSAQPWSAQVGIAAVLLGFTAVVLIICWIIDSRLAIDKHTDGIILREIARLQNGGSKADVDADTKAVVERLTGLKYEDCWKA